MMSTVCHYPTDVSDAQWESLQLLLPPRGEHVVGLDVVHTSRGLAYLPAASQAFGRGG